MIIIENEFEIGQMVYLRTDSDQLPRLVTALIYRAGGYMTYELSHGTATSWHNALEFTLEKDVLAATTN
ncbi:hypothetical protein QMK33_19770 [Hymenobacter sp. H14-R3]|uniref:hypothetical protein n=1 Tax=Hymenobacter sp. H14-R3 TaxID=3046308 RepID=UPI0024B89E85|nr:hypothetical protein [Hymenobacter sp. H14-R3]MDJ0367393.1 hypothetical protein [Hymenobacter sp. H14-R3]